MEGVISARIVDVGEFAIEGESLGGFWAEDGVGLFVGGVGVEILSTGRVGVEMLSTGRVGVVGRSTGEVAIGALLIGRMSVDELAIEDAGAERL